MTSFPSFTSAMSRNRKRKSSNNRFRVSSAADSPPDKSGGVVAGDGYEDGGDKQRKVPEPVTLFRRFWKVAAPYWFSDDKAQARLQLAAVFALSLGTTGISVGFNFLGRDFFNALANKDQEQFTKQLLYYLGAFAGGIPVSS